MRVVSWLSLFLSSVTFCMCFSRQLGPQKFHMTYQNPVQNRWVAKPNPILLEHSRHLSFTGTSYQCLGLQDMQIEAVVAVVNGTGRDVPHIGLPNRGMAHSAVHHFIVCNLVAVDEDEPQHYALPQHSTGTIASRHFSLHTNPVVGSPWLTPWMATPLASTKGFLQDGQVTRSIGSTCKKGK